MEEIFGDDSDEEIVIPLVKRAKQEKEDTRPPPPQSEAVMDIELDDEDDARLYGEGDPDVVKTGSRQLLRHDDTLDKFELPKNMESLLHQILELDPNLKDPMKNTITSCISKYNSKIRDLSQVTTFSDTQLYQVAFLPYLITNFAQDLYEKIKNSENSPSEDLFILFKKEDDNFVDFRCFSMKTGASSGIFSFQTGDFVLINRVLRPNNENDPKSIWKRSDLGYVVHHHIRKTDPNILIENIVAKTLDKNLMECIVHEFTIKVKNSIDFVERMDYYLSVKRLGNLHSFILQAKGLIDLSQSPLSSNLITPKELINISSITIQPVFSSGSDEDLNAVQKALDLVIHNDEISSKILCFDTGSAERRHLLKQEIIEQIFRALKYCIDEDTKGCVIVLSETQSLDRLYNDLFRNGSEKQREDSTDSPDGSDNNCKTGELPSKQSTSSTENILPGFGDESEAIHVAPSDFRGKVIMLGSNLTEEIIKKSCCREVMKHLEDLQKSSRQGNENDSANSLNRQSSRQNFDTSTNAWKTCLEYLKGTRSIDDLDPQKVAEMITMKRKKLRRYIENSFIILSSYSNLMETIDLFAVFNSKTSKNRILCCIIDDANDYDETQLVGLTNYGIDKFILFSEFKEKDGDKEDQARRFALKRSLFDRMIQNSIEKQKASETLLAGNVNSAKSSIVRF